MTDSPEHRPLLCTRCGGLCAVVEDTYGHIDWGPAVIDDDGIVRPEYPDPADGYQTVVDSGISGVRACCMNDACGHWWRLRRQFAAPGSD